VHLKRNSMSKSNKALIAAIVFFISWTSGMAQEELGNLWNRSATGVYLENSEQQYIDAERAEEDVKINYLFNTLELPVVDDFAKYKIKYFVTDTNHASVFDSLTYTFTENGSYTDTLRYVTDTVYNYIFNPSTQKLDSSIAPPIKIRFYLDTTNKFVASDSLIVFPNYSVITQNGISRKQFYQEDSVLVNKITKHYFAYDDDRSLWISEGGFWNRTMGLNPPTVGVITFDGLNSDGKPYDNSSRLTYGAADRFTSKPINLYGDNTGRYTSSDSIYLSFYYQPYGNGDQPEVEDSLVLEFYSPVQKRWNIVWSKKGDTLQEFQQVYFHMADTIYLQVGFQFRFRNYATLSGNFDHWHVDYIRLAKDRRKNDHMVDIAFTKPIRTFLKHYTSIPWTHYKAKPYSYVAENVTYHLRNLDTATALAPSDYKVHLNGQVNPFFKSEVLINIAAPANTTFTEVHSVNSAPNNFIFPIDTNERQLFEINARFSGANDQLPEKENDTLKHVQLFDRYYSYDDGSAEKTYHLNLVGTTVVIEFKTPISDTLKSVMINFVETFEPPSSQKINIVVYKDLNSSPIYQSGPVDVIYNAEGKFHRYHIDPIVVEGQFYVGYQQLDQNKTFVGYDVNYNNQGRTYISQIDGDWTNSIFLGTTMIRASFGDGSEEPLSNEQVVSDNDQLEFYPNPAQDWIKFKQEVNSDIEVYSIGGKLEMREYVIDHLNISNLPNGFYLIRSNKSEVSKLIINR